MAREQMQYYGLSQWEAVDKVERVDFNSDNAKIDGALHALAEQVQPLVRAVPQLAYYIGQLAILDLLDRGQYLGQRAMLYEAFLHPEDLTLSGSAEIRAGVLCLDGTGSTGGITTLPLSLGSSDWTQARMWVHFSGGTVQPRLNGQELPLHRAGRDKTVTGIRCSEYEFLWEGKGSGAAQIQLELTCGSGGEMKVYDYCLTFF